MLLSALVEKNKNAAIAMELDLQCQLLIVSLEYHHPFPAHYAIILRLHAVANNNNNNNVISPSYRENWSIQNVNPATKK
jgi:hypothetical protein